MSVNWRCPRRRRGSARWVSLAMVVAAVAIAAACSFAAQPTPVLATQPPTSVADTAPDEPALEPSSSGALLFLGNQNIAPVVYLDGTAPAGLAVDMVRALSTHMSQPVEIRAMDWTQAQALVASGHADALIQINATPERREIFDFSDPFLESHFAIFVRADQGGINGVSSLRGRRVGVESGGLPQQLLGKDPRIPLTVIHSFPEGFRMLSAGAIDAVVVDYRVGSYVLATNGITNIKVAGDPIGSSRSSIAVRKGNTALLNEINNALRIIKADGTYEGIIADWAPTEGVFATRRQISDWILYAAIVTLLVLLVVALTWAATLRSQMRRKRVAEAALRESATTYRSLVNAMAEGVVFQGADGRVTAVNPAAERIEGRAAEAMIGRTSDSQWRAIREDGAPFPSAMLPATVTLRTGEPQTDVVMGIHRPDGTLVWISVNSGPLVSADETTPHAVVTTFRDITEHRLAEQALRISQRKLALHIQQTLLGVIEWDTEFRAREWNPAAEAIFGYSREEALGRHAAELILSEAVRPDAESVWHNLSHQVGGQFNTNENVTKDGRTILCEWVNTPLTDEGGTVVGVMSLARDVTERAQAEQLRVAKEAADAASVAKSAFLANMSHEIRTPMNAILGFSQLMRHENGLSRRQRTQLDIINSSGEHLLALINDVLELSKVEAGRISVSRAAFNLHSMLDEMESLFGLRAETKGLLLRVVRSEAVPRFVVTDENKLRQVFVNLLGNAVKFTDSGSVELRVDVRRNEGGGLRLTAEVRDTGQGIAPEDAERLFEYFEQAEAPAGRESHTGTGLGLAISREFVQLLGGAITVDSQVGVGSVFTFEIAIEEAKEDAVVALSEERHVVGLCPGEPSCRVLVADDSPDNRELLVELLEPAGFEVRAVSNGKEALEEFAAWHPQIVLMDMRMPVMDGYEATRRIRATPAGAEVPIIGVTAGAFAEMRQGVFDAGVDEFVVKPFREGELFDKIGKLVGVHYVYDEELAEIEPDVGSLGVAALAALPPDLVARIRRATMVADFDAVLGMTDEVGMHDERSAEGLRALADRFDAECILSALGGAGES